MPPETRAGKISFIPEAPVPPAPAVPPPMLDADKVYFALAHPGRRRLLESLAMKRNCTAAEVVPGGGLKQDATSKQLQELVKAGLCTTAVDGQDGRRRRYALHPGLAASQRPLGDGPGLLHHAVVRAGCATTLLK